MNANSKENQIESVEKPNLASACLESCKKILAQIEEAKSSIVAEFRGRLAEHGHLLDLAMNEAEALVWETEFPHLLFPALAVEKANAVATWHTRQQSLRRAVAA